MDQIEQLVQEIKEMNKNLKILIQNLAHPAPSPRIHKIPAAARILEVSPALLRHLCDRGVIPSGLTNDNPRNKHYVVDVDKAKQALIDGGYIRTKVVIPTKRGPKPKTSIL